MRAIIFALSIFLWALLGWFYYQLCVDCCHSDATDTSGIISDADQKDAAATAAMTNNETKDEGMSDYLMFNWSDGEPVLRDDWGKYKQSLIDGLDEGELLEITGYYRSDETNDSSFDNLGLARANKIKGLLSPPIDGDRIELKSQLMDGDVDKDNLFVSSNIRTFRRTATIDETIPDKTIIRFPFNSTRKLNNNEVEQYLDQVAKRVKSSGESVRLTGHTDNIGSIESNILLGRKRAIIIRDYLVSKGVSTGKILVATKGEGSPVASNSTSVGRAQNRRTELEIIK